MGGSTLQARFETKQLFYTTDFDRLDKFTSMHITGQLANKQLITKFN